MRYHPAFLFAAVILLSTAAAHGAVVVRQLHTTVAVRVQTSGDVGDLCFKQPPLFSGPLTLALECPGADDIGSGHVDATFLVTNDSSSPGLTVLELSADGLATAERHAPAPAFVIASWNISCDLQFELTTATAFAIELDDDATVVEVDGPKSDTFNTGQYHGRSFDSLQRSGTLPPGRYSATIRAEGGASVVEDRFFTNVRDSVDFTLRLGDGPSGTNFSWSNPAGGNFGVETNWDPQGVPTHDGQTSDTAIFGLVTDPNDGFVNDFDVSATNARAGQFIIDANVRLHGNAQLFSTSPENPSLSISGGGRVTLDGAHLTSVNTAVGLGGPESLAGVFVDAEDTVWRNTGGLIVGAEERHDGFVDFTGGLFQIDGEAHVGRLAPGEVTLDGEFSEWQGATLFVGADQARGTLNVTNGAVLTSRDATIGAGPAAGSRATVQGANPSGNKVATWLCDGTIAVGGPNGGQLEVSDAAEVKPAALHIAPADSSTGEVTVGGVAGPQNRPAALSVTNEIMVGEKGRGELHILTGGSVSALGEVQIGGTGAATAVVTGAGAAPGSSTLLPSTLSSSDALIVSSPAGATLRIEANGRVEAPSVTVGIAGETGQIEVVGNSGPFVSTLHASQELGVGNGGTGTVNVTSGGLIDVGGAVSLAHENGGLATLTLDGVDAATGRRSTLTAHQTDPNGSLAGLSVGTDTTRGDVVVKNGAKLQTESDFVNNGTVTITNQDNRPPFDPATGQGGAHWISRGIILGGPVNPQIVVDGGGIVLADFLSAGPSSNERGTVTVRGLGSRLQVKNSIDLGPNGTGQLSIGSGAFVVSGAVQGLGGVGGLLNGEAVVSGVGGVPGRWDIVAPRLDVGVPPRQQLDENQASLAVTVDEAMSALGFDPNATLSAKLTIDGGRVDVLGTLRVGRFGTVQGAGDVFAVDLENHGIVSPGLVQTAGGPPKLIHKPVLQAADSSIATLNVHGDYEQFEEGVLKIEVAGLAPGQFDVLKINGNAKLAGRADLKFIDGFVPKPGDNVDFVQVSGTVEGVLKGGTIEVPADEAAGTPGLTVEAKWEVTPEGTCRMTVTAVTAANESALNAPTIPGCGAGLCGAGVVPMLPNTLVGLLAMRPRLRRRTTQTDTARRT